MPSRLYSSCSCFNTSSKTIILLLFIFQKHATNQQPTDKQLLQFLIAIVDAKLLKTISLKYLKAVDVQHAQHIVERFLRFMSGHDDRFVDATNDPGEQSIVDGLRQSVSTVFGLDDTVRLHHDVSASGDRALRESRLEVRFGDLEKAGGVAERRLIGDDDIFFVN